MRTTAAPTFRDTLRRATRPEHDRIDDAVSTLDLALARDFAVFLEMNRLGFGAIAAAEWTPHHVSRAALADIIAAADRDLVTLGHTDRPALPVPAPVAPQAVDHIVLGSRLGTQVLRRRWAATTDAGVAAANAYFQCPAMAPQWRAHLDALGDDDVPHDRVIADTTRLFAVFGAALQQARRTIAAR